MVKTYEQLPEFGTIEKCKACGAKHKGMTYLTVVDYDENGNSCLYAFMRCICLVCGFCWDEKPLFLCEDESGVQYKETMDDAKEKPARGTVAV